MRIGVVAAAISVCIVGLAAAQGVNAAIRKDTYIPAGGLGPALQTLAKEYGFQVLYRTEIVGSLRTAGAVGQFTPDEALKQVLNGTGLTYRYLDEKTITITPMAATTGGSGEIALPSRDSPGAADPMRGNTLSADTLLLLAQASGAQAGGNSSVKSQDQATLTNQPSILQEVIVTAQKRQERLVDVPISMVALSADDLQHRNIASLDDLAAAVPGMSVNSQGSYNRRIFLRGVSNLAGTGNASLIGMYLDEADVTSGPFSQIDVRTYDLERVEVLRGPQGTLYGDGSAGGTVRFITRNPQLDSFAMQRTLRRSLPRTVHPGSALKRW